MGRADRALKIVHACSTSEISGANRYVFDLASAQIRLGHDVTVCAPRSPAESFAFADDDTPIKAFGGVYAWSLNRSIASCKPDIIHCHGGKAARWLRYMPRRAPSVITIHSRYKPKTMSHLDALIYISGWQADMVSPFEGPKTLVPNWVPEIASRTPEEAAAFRADLGVSPSEFLIGFMGRLNFGKGADLLISAVQRIENSDLRIAIIGEGGSKEDLISRAGLDERFSFHETMPDPSLFYASCDLIVVPSRQEAFGLVALEAMSAGAPVLVNDREGLAELARHYPENRVNAEDSSVFSERIRAFIGKKTGPAILRQSYDIARFDRDKSVASIIEVYRNTIAGHARSDA